MILLGVVGSLEMGGLTSGSLFHFRDAWGMGVGGGVVIDLKRPLLGISALSYRSPYTPFRQVDITISNRFGFKGGTVYSIGVHYILSDYLFSNRALILFGGFGNYSYSSSFEAGASYSMYGGDLSYGVLQVSADMGRLLHPKVWLDVFGVLSQVSDTSRFQLSRSTFPSLGASLKLFLGRFTPYAGGWLGEQFLTVKWYGLVVYSYPFVYRGGAFLGVSFNTDGIRPGVHITYDRLWDPVAGRFSPRLGVTFHIMYVP